MTSNAQKKSGFLLPDVINPGSNICIQFEIPDTDEYRAATRGLVASLGQWWIWEKSYLPGDNRAAEAAALFREIILLTYQEGCVTNCDQTVDCIEADPNYIGLNSVIFSQSLASTQAHVQALEDEYDGSAQSVGPNIPASAPDSDEQDALCYALQSYIELYAATKSGLIEQKNALQILWGSIREAQNKVFNSVIDLLAPIYTFNLYDCWVDDDEALVALADTSAIEAVACCLLDELDGVAMTESNFDDAIVDCATSLTGTAGDIACVLSNDWDLEVYLLFLESYNIALQRQINGETLPCNCNQPDCAYFDFFTSDYGFVNIDASGTAGNQFVGTYSDTWRASNSTNQNPSLLFRAIYIGKSFANAATVTEVTLNRDYLGGNTASGYVRYNARVILLNNGSVVYDTYPSGNSTATVDDESFTVSPNVVADEIRLAVAVSGFLPTPTGDAAFNWLKITSDSPIGIGDECP